jgi:hypothetical protein
MAADEYVPSGETVIWRYIKLNSFLELLSGHFVQTRIDMLNDAAEGAYGFRNVAVAPQVLQRLQFNGKAVDPADVVRRARRFVAATYWFEYKERESHGMWSIYGRTGESVAIETTVAALHEILSRKGDVRIERMRYEPMRGEVSDLHTMFFHKRIEYREEDEIRSVQVFSQPLQDAIVDQRISLDDLNLLIKRIILAPHSRATFVEAVNQIVESLFARENKRFTGEICSSSLDEDLVPQ